ncbi:uncharacterized protein LOC132311445 [Cornus florida]|uniref:uncharacterized protein LOC132311445 n=1 Tax=Cornus florida TaxID=4283 RepID=UPI002899CD3A|nr:uncharacterized protein LOC132311445 [Cornus florida]
MPSAVSAEISTTQLQKLQFSPNNSFNRTTLTKTLAISGLVLYLFSIFLFNDHPNCQASHFFLPLGFTRPTPPKPNPTDHHSPTDLSHIVFGLLGSEKGWRYRKSYVETWWRPNVTRGYLYLDRAPAKDLFPWSSSSPPFRVFEDNAKLLDLEESKHVAPILVRLVHAILEAFRQEQEGVRWYVMGDDDTIFFVDNMVGVLSGYDHTKYFYIGGHSETLRSNFFHSFDMGFGGAGFALSYPLAAALARDLENCLERYWYLRVSDQFLMSCVADFGVSLTAHKGLHQIDLLHDISGLLSAHPQAPLLSLHHFDKVDPIFPAMNRIESTNHLMKAANVDQSRLLQQTICYQKQTNRSFSISWGYSAHVYENVFPRSILKKPLETFRPWSKDRPPRPPHYRFDTRWPSDDPCEAPHVFFFESVGKSGRGDEIVTNYVRSWPRGLPACSVFGNHSADYISKIQVLSPVMKLPEDGRSECCDVSPLGGTNIIGVKLRACMEDEIIA